ncbi:ribonuclease Z [Candidatus Pacearchaeota archaeon]|nr:ribonuclease Z [Candidatus Pacearchaeota archaeon]
MSNKISITFLGTGSAIPTEKRNHISILLNYKEENILIDCGEGTQRQFRKAKLNPCKLTRLLLTHFHGDHTFGIPGLFQTLALNSYQKTLQIYGPKGTKRFINNIFQTFIPKSNRIKVDINKVKGKFLETKDFKINALPLNHDSPCNGYLFEEKDRLRIDKNKIKHFNLPNIQEISKLTLGKNIKFNNRTIKFKDVTYLQKGRRICFILDTKLCPNTIKLAKNSDLLIAESTFLEDSENGNRLADDYKHLTAKQAAEIAKKAKVKQLILTHFSQRYDNKESLLLNEAKKVFPNTKISEDLMRIEI